MGDRVGGKGGGGLDKGREFSARQFCLLGRDRRPWGKRDSLSHDRKGKHVFFGCIGVRRTYYGEEWFCRITRQS